MIIGLFCTLILPLITGLIILSPVLARRSQHPACLLLTVSMAAGLGVGITSCTYFLFLLSDNSFNKKPALYEIAALILLYIFTLFLNRNNRYSESYELLDRTTHVVKLQRVLTYVLYAAVTLAVITFLLRSFIMPHGEWDAWTIWNLRARFLSRAREQWIDTFSPLLHPHHPDYPLLIPITVARGWAYIGKESQIIPIMTGMLFTFGTCGVILSSLFILRGKSQGFLATIVLLGTTNFVLLGTYQYADIPVGFFFLSTIVLLSFQDRSPENRALSLAAGMMAGLSCWTKNEGFLFLVAILVARPFSMLLFGYVKWYKRQMISFAGGFLPIVAITLYFRIRIAPANDLMAQVPRQIVDKMLDVSRYWLILKAFSILAFTTFPIIALMTFYSFYLGINKHRAEMKSLFTSIIVLCLMISGYFIVYVISPYDLNWHLGTSFTRILTQLWPSFVFVYFMLVNTPEQMLLDNNRNTIS